MKQIKEIYKGHYQVILDFPDASILEKLIDQSYKYFWVVEHREASINWTEYNYTLYELNMSKKRFKRGIFSWNI